MQRQRTCTYRLVNHTKREIYYGASKAVTKRFATQHCAGTTKALRHWRCGLDNISRRTIACHRTQGEASGHAHELERRPPPPGYTVIRTGGV